MYGGMFDMFSQGYIDKHVLVLIASRRSGIAALSFVV